MVTGYLGWLPDIWDGCRLFGMVAGYSGWLSDIWTEDDSFFVFFSMALVVAVLGSRSFRLRRI